MGIKKTYQKAFTLIEILIVVAILGVLAVALIIVINPTKKINSAKDAKVKSDMAQVVGVLQGYFASADLVRTDKTYPNTLQEFIDSGELKYIPQQQNGALNCETGEPTTGSQNYCYVTNSIPFTYNGTIYPANGVAALWGTTWGEVSPGNDIPLAPPVRSYYWCWDSIANGYRYQTNSPDIFPTTSSPVCPDNVPIVTPTVIQFPTSTPTPISYPIPTLTPTVIQFPTSTPTPTPYPIPTLAPARWVAVGQNSLAYSSDGIHWDNAAWPGSIGIGNSVAWNGSMWVAVGWNYNSSGFIGYSSDGIHWASATWPGGGSGQAVAWNGSMWVAVGGGDNSVIYSYNGIHWASAGTSAFGSGGWGTAVAWNGSMWVALGGGNINTMAYSYDGINWIGLGKSIFTSSNGDAVAWNGSMWVAVGGTFAYSSDGIHWVNIGKPSFLGNRGWGCGVAWNGSMWVAVGNRFEQELGSPNVLDIGSTIAYSYDGINWTGLGASIFGGRFSDWPTDVAWNGSMWVVVGFGGDGSNIAAYSYDGIHWTGSGKVFSQGRGVASSIAPRLYPPR